MVPYPYMDIKRIEEIKRIALIAMFSDDDLMETLVLKGGNALDLVYGISPRSSLDLDFSIENDFKDIEKTKSKIEAVLTRTFDEKGYKAFDISLVPRPQTPSIKKPKFWGGYDVEFKVIDKEKYNLLCADPELLRKQSIDFTSQHNKKFKIQISKYEFCGNKEEKEIEGYTIFVYPPVLLVFEKLRSICQQMKEYSHRETNATARARDFFDIYVILDHFKVDIADPVNLTLLREVFNIKQVPLELLKLIDRYREFHQMGFSSLQDTIKPGEKLRSFDFYFEYVVELTTALCHALGIK
jgi:predicted nucleotidyltransferase component of viral defense system